MLGVKYSNSTDGKSIGFTIVETMVVLAVTGVLFVSFAATISGKQSQTKFKQAINSVKTQLDEVVSQSQSGYYPPGGFSCSANPGASKEIKIDTGSGTEQGANDGCILLGKTVQFYTDSDPQRFIVYPVAGSNKGKDFSDSSPVIINDSRDEVFLEHGLTIAWARSGGTKSWGVAFGPSFAYKASGSPEYGSNTTKTMPLGTNENAPEGQINAKLKSASEGEMQICLVSGTTTGQSGLITIGGAAGSNTVSLSIKGNDTCA